MLDSSDIKQALKNAGFEVYRTKGAVVHVAERVRENLIMDSGVRIDGEGGMVSFYTRAQKGDFPGEGADELFARARKLGAEALDNGFREARSFVTEVPDPGDPDVTLDHWYQVQYERPVESVDDALEQVRFAFGLDKLARR